jgi:hypothetical protein
MNPKFILHSIKALLDNYAKIYSRNDENWTQHQQQNQTVFPQRQRLFLLKAGQDNSLSDFHISSSSFICKTGFIHTK